MKNHLLIGKSQIPQTFCITSPVSVTLTLGYYQLAHFRGWPVCFPHCHFSVTSLSLLCHFFVTSLSLLFHSLLSSQFLWYSLCTLYFSCGCSGIFERLADPPDHKPAPTSCHCHIDKVASLCREADSSCSREKRKRREE